ncbi:MAG: pseudouridine synthase [Bacteroidia bacterium]|jgi:23S rRNA pseudouridine2604 synthase|nr:pseudouridine synthase [Bacteroidia bacterium]
MSVLRLRTVISRALHITNDEADLVIGAGRVRVNGMALPPSAKIDHHEEITLDGKILREEKKFIYLLFHKPRGVECTLNDSIADNLLTSFHFPERLYPVGRLDKYSEGLLLMTNNGKVFKHIAWSEMNKEKEYVVEINAPVTPEFLAQMAAGVEIMGKLTRPAHTAALENQPNRFRIILTQGLNRQIRRMSSKLGYKVTRLQRIRIMHLHLNDLEPGRWRMLDAEEEKQLLHMLETEK